MRVAYFTNQYPAITHTFIRREIRAVEQLGTAVTRYAIRRPSGEIVDPEDKREAERTNYILAKGFGEFLRCFTIAMACHPVRTTRMLIEAVKIGACSDRGLLRHFAYLGEAFVLATWCERDRIQHVHVHFGTNATVVAMLASTLSLIPFSFTAHGPEEFERALPLSLAEKIHNATFVVCVSSFGRSQAMRWSEPSQWAKIALVRCGLEAGSFVNAAPSAPSKFVCVGRICVEKGQLILVDAVARLRDTGVHCEVTLVGDGPMRRDVESAIQRLRLEKQISVTGWLAGDRVRDQLATARALVLASFSENLPVVIMEAFAHGRPVISTYIAGIPELVRPGENGWLVPAGDSVALADAMREALGAPTGQLTAMGSAGRALVLKQHNVDTEAAKLVSLFHGSHRPALSE